MIPKTIHYVWVGDNKPSRFINNCIKSWMRYFPDFEVKLWSEKIFDVNSNPFVKAAYESKKWAFVADYLRLYALYTEGGIYFDTDVKVYKRFDDFLYHDISLATESMSEDESKVGVDSGIMGTIPNHPFFKECLNFYDNLNLNFKELKKDDWGDIVPAIPVVLSRCLEKYGFDYKNKTTLLNDNIKVYSTKNFGHGFWDNPKQGYFAVHYYMGSWRETKRGKFYKFCYDNDLIHLYHKIQKSIIKIKNFNT